jgi:Flp pilus assembly protein TadG
MINSKTRISNRNDRIRNQNGSVILTFAISLVAIFCFAVVAIDGAILMTTKNELQCAADAAALAGASGLRAADPVATARARAIAFAGHNFAVQDTMRPCLITDADVEVNTDLQDSWVRVTTHRTAATDDPLRTYFLKILDVANGLSPTRSNTVDVKAVAKAELVDICAAKCVKPWAIPDRWEDVNTNGVFDPGQDFYDPNITGYLAPGDVGVQITLKQGQGGGSPEVPGQYNPIDLPPLPGNPVTGANAYRDWISTCCPWTVAPGDTCVLETGNMQGPTIQGVVDLINQDPNAVWNPITKEIDGSAYGQSPRVALVPFYDPNYGPHTGKGTVVISKIGAFFIESVGPGSQVNGRFVQVSAPGEPCANNTGNSLVIGLHLIE